MGEIRLFAIGIDEARDIFAAPAGVADRLRSAAEPLFPPPPPKRGLLDKLGPLMRKPLLPPPDVPLPVDAENVLAGRYPHPERVPATWALLEHWLGELAWGTFAMTIDQAELDRWDFDLARAGMSSQYSVGKLFNEELGYPIRPLPGQRTGYIRHSQALNAAAALELSREQLEGDSASRTDELLGWLQHYPQWADEAAAAGRPAPDLVGLMTL
jgi:hypothetical protein